MTAPNLQLVNREIEFNFVHTVNGGRQSNGHTLSLPSYVGNKDSEIKAYIIFALSMSGYKEITSIEIDVEEILQAV